MERILPIPLLLALAACNQEGPVEPPPYQGAVHVDGRYYLLAAERVLTVEEEAQLGQPWWRAGWRATACG